MMRFSLKLRPEELSAPDEVFGESIESIWWDEEGNISGILSASNRLLFEARCANFGISKEEIQYFPLEEQDWLAADQEKLSPIEIGQFFVCPPHYSGTLPQEKICIEIDSPHAFGSGHHETTQSCLHLLQELAGRIEVDQALDVGCGSGILAIAMGMLWQKPVYATDCAPSSVQSTHANARRAGLESIFPVECYGLEHPLIRERAPFDLITANIHSEPLIALAPALCLALAEHGRMILSGILQEQEQDVIKAYFSEGMSVIRTQVADNWSTLVLKHKNGNS